MLQVIFHKVRRREERPGRFPVYHVSAVGCLSTPIKSTRSISRAVTSRLPTVSVDDPSPYLARIVDEDGNASWYESRYAGNITGRTLSFGPTAMRVRCVVVEKPGPPPGPLAHYVALGRL